MHIEIDYRLTRRDVAWVTLAAFRANRGAFVLFLGLFWLLPWAAAMLGVLSPAAAMPWWLSALLWVAPVVMVATLLAFGQADAAGSGLLDAPLTLVLSDDGIEHRGDAFAATVPWSTITRATWMRGGLLLMAGKRVVTAVRARYLDADRAAAVKALLREKLSTARG